jgi:hypothetical protein
MVELGVMKFKPIQEPEPFVTSNVIPNMFVNDTNPGPLFFDAAGAKPPFLDARRAIV